VIYRVSSLGLEGDMPARWAISVVVVVLVVVVVVEVE
jgi:hypothetical protein